MHIEQLLRFGGCFIMDARLNVQFLTMEDWR
jgi:hypothetical protein